MHTENIIENNLIYYFKNIFKENNTALSKLISDITNIPYSKLKNNLVFITNEESITKINKKNCYIIKINNVTLNNIFVNKNKYNALSSKNISYSLNLYSNNNNDFLLIGINLNTFSNKNNNYLDMYELQNKEGIKYIDNFKIYTLDIVKCFNLYYKNPKTNDNIIKWGAFLYSNKNNKNITKILLNTLNKKELEIIKSKLKEL